MRRTRRLDGRDQYLAVTHWPKQRFQMLGTRQWLVSLDIYVDIGLDTLGPFVHAVRSAAMLRRCHFGFPAGSARCPEYVFGVGGTNDGAQQRRRFRRLVDVRDHRVTG